MKKLISLLCLLVCVLMLASCGGGTSEYEYNYDCWGEITLWADFTDEERTSRAICWQEDKDGALTLFLPSGMNEFYIWFDGADAVKIDGAGVHAGDLCAIEDGAHTLTAGEYSYDFNVMRSSDLPAVIITTESGSLDAVNQSADHSVREAGEIYIRSHRGETEFVGEMSEIRGRGNSSWNYEKKPYQFKLPDKPSLFGMEQSRTWLLLAQHNDPSLIRNGVYFEIAERAGIPFTCDYKPCDVWANGLYLGSYLLCEKIDVADGRVEITDLEKANEEAYPAIVNAEFKSENGMRWCESSARPSDITGGYLLETDYAARWADEDCGFVTDRGMYVVIKSPANATYDQVKYIRDLVCDMENALYAEDGKNAKGKHYTEYIETESLAAMQIIDELSLRLDAGLSSFYFYKDSDRSSNGKFTFAPVWDFDFSNGNTVSSATCPDSWWWTTGIAITETRTPGWYAAACAHKDYRELLCEVYNDRFADMLGGIDDMLAGLADRTAASAKMNFTVWDLAKVPVAYSYEGCDSREAAITLFADSLKARADMLSKKLTEADTLDFTQPAFYDLPEDEAVSEAILYVYDKGWMSGTELYTFSPEMPLYRMMLPVILSNVLEVDCSEYSDHGFEDVNDGEWYADELAWCVAEGIIKNDGPFGAWEQVDEGYLYSFLSLAAERFGFEAPESPDDPSTPIDRADTALRFCLSFGNK